MRLALACSVRSLALAPAALADVPPRPGYEEPCTVERRAAAGDQGCVVCRDAYHAAPEACATELAGQGLERRCRTRGASVWAEVWCKAGASASPAEVATPTSAARPAAKSGGSSCAATPASGASTWALAGLALLFARRRR